MKVIDLFCSCGGFSEGFKQAGFEIKYGVDIDKTVKNTYEHNHPNTEFILSDIRELNPEDFREIDVVIGSPPCPEFSQAKADRDPTRGMVLVDCMYAWIEQINPKFWIMENVPGIYEHLNNKYRRRILDAVNYGVPQFRKRCFHGLFNVPLATHIDPTSFVTVRQAIGDLIDLMEYSIISKKFSVTGNKNNDRFSTLDEPAGTITTIPPSLVPNLVAIKSSQDVMKKRLSSKFGMHNRYAKFDLDKPSCTITDMHGDSPIIKCGKDLRRLTVRECARLQSFPDDFIFYGSKSNCYKMIGNAVPPLLAKKLAEALFIKESRSYMIF